MKQPRRIALVALLGALALLLVAAISAGAATPKPKTILPPAKVKVGRVAFGRTPSGRLVGLVAVRYPIQAAGRKMTIGVAIEGHKRVATQSALVEAGVSAGPLRRPERRRAFTFVHEVPLTKRVAAAVEVAARDGQAVRVRVSVDGKIDIDQDGVPDLGSTAMVGRRIRPLAKLTPASARAAASKAFCADFPTLELAPGKRATVALPACEGAVRWSVTADPGAGSANLVGKSIAYVAPRTPGTQTVKLDHGTLVVQVVKPWSTAAQLGKPGGEGPVVRAIGDSVTAGFGYYGNGSLMGILELPECKPFGKVLDDACSSNSTATKNGLEEVPYAADYGLANNVSWAAQWANEYGISNYKNFAISGSEPTNWAPGGDDYALTKQIEAENPDYLLMTIGANPILSETLFGREPMQCALEADIFGGYAECVEAAFERVHLRAELKRLYANLVENTKATIYVMEYHLSVPSSALLYSSVQIAEMAKLMNETIAGVVAEVNSPRLHAVEPPHFDVGVNLEPVYPSTDECHYLGELVDGPSVQSTPSQVELRITNPLTFCGGPTSGEPWVISGDTGIHPSATGYAQMASQVPPPAPQG